MQAELRDEMLLVEDVQKRLNLPKPHSIYALIRERELAAVDVSTRPGGRPTWRIPASALCDFIRRRMTTTTGGKQA